MRNPLSNPPRSIGERIRYSRKAKGYSQADLARRVGVSQPAIANWETGLHDPRRLALAKLADVLDTPLDWLSAGARSVTESDTHAAAAYLRRANIHVPVISFENAGRFAFDGRSDPHVMAEDYIPLTANSDKMFAVFITDDAMNKTFVRDTLVVIDYSDRVPANGAFCLIEHDESSILRRWNAVKQIFETHSTDPSPPIPHKSSDSVVIGCARVSIRFH